MEFERAHLVLLPVSYSEWSLQAVLLSTALSLTLEWVSEICLQAMHSALLCPTLYPALTVQPGDQVI